MKNNPGKKYNRFYRHIFLCNDAKYLVYFDQNWVYIIESQVQLCISAFLMHASILWGNTELPLPKLFWIPFPLPIIHLISPACVSNYIDYY